MYAIRSYYVAHVIDAGHERAENLAVADDAADRRAAEVDAVIAALAADQARAVALPAYPMVGERELQRRLHRLGAGIGEEHLRQAFGRERRDLVGELEGKRMPELERRREIERFV